MLPSHPLSSYHHPPPQALVTIREMVDRALAGDMFPAAFETLKLARDTFVAVRGGGAHANALLS